MWRPLIGLFAVILVMVGSIFAGTKWSDATWAPKLALDLEGGTQIILQAVTTNNEPVSSEDINQAIEIIRQRVDSSGVAEAEITSQGGQNIVVALPGKPTQETLDLVRESAQMQFRPVLYFDGPEAVDLDALEAEAEASAGEAATEDATEEGTSTEASTTEPSAAESTAPAETEEATSQEDATGDTDVTATEEATTPAAEPTNASDMAWVTDELLNEFYAFDCTDPANLTGGGGVKDPTQPVIVCDAEGTSKYILGPMEISGSQIDSATSGMETNNQGVAVGSWMVQIKFTSEGAKQFSDVTARLSEQQSYEQWITDPQGAPNMFAMVLDNLVISAPSVTERIPNGEASITGNFTNESANQLASQLNFGALPLTFEVQSEETISATLGSEQLEKGLIAGLIGLALVAVYSLIQYRALGTVTIVSLIVASALTLLSIVLLSWLQGYRLSLPGVAGMIVAIGVTADSFIVYFERIRDELRDGRDLPSAVEIGWERARRTIIASDAINFIAAIVLYFLAVGGVRGFAFTLGLTTLIDLIVVFFFTHPVMRLLARTKFFGEGHKLSGFHHTSLGLEGPRYVGRGKVKGSKKPKPQELNADGSRMTIAQRKAAENAAANSASASSPAIASEDGED